VERALSVTAKQKANSCPCVTVVNLSPECKHKYWLSMPLPLCPVTHFKHTIIIAMQEQTHVLKHPHKTIFVHCMCLYSWDLGW